MIRHIIFLVHPCCYEKVDPEELRRSNWQLFLDRESEVKGRWLAALAKRPEQTLFVQQCGPEYLVENARRELGDAYAVRLGPPFHEGMAMHQFYESIEQELRAHLKAHDLSFDPATVTSELWGESFEGCVPGYGGMFAQYLGLQKPPRMRFEMTVYDTRWLYGAKEPQALPIPDSDVEAWIFECHDGSGAAMYQARRHAQWIDQRRVTVRLNTRRTQVWGKRGHALWPAEQWAKGDPEEMLEYTMTLIEANWRWIRGIEMDMKSFTELVVAARVLPPAPEGG